MSVSGKNLILVNTDFLYEGLDLDCSLYYIYNKKYVLLCKQVCLTNILIGRLEQIASIQGGIYVNIDNYKQILLKSFQQNTKKNKRRKKKEAIVSPVEHDRISIQDYEKALKIQAQYNDLSDETVDMFDEVIKSGKIRAEFVQDISNTISTELVNADDNLILQCINKIRAVDDYLYSHSLNVAMLNGLLGKWMGLPKEENEKLIKVGLLHDIGKLDVPQDILNKPGKLTSEEFEQIKEHAVHSYLTLKNSGELDQSILMGVRWHHEKINGRGYPDGIKNDGISLFARITSIADVYDAMVSKRCYKDSHSPFDILGEFAEYKFSDFDLEIVTIFTKNMAEMLIGKRVLLSTGEEGIVLYVSPESYQYPMVKIDDRVITTSPECKCVSISSVVFNF